MNTGRQAPVATFKMRARRKGLSGRKQRRHWHFFLDPRPPLLSSEGRRRPHVTRRGWWLKARLPQLGLGCPLGSRDPLSLPDLPFSPLCLPTSVPRSYVGSGTSRCSVRERPGTGAPLGPPVPGDSLSPHLSPGCPVDNCPLLLDRLHPVSPLGTLISQRLVLSVGWAGRAHGSARGAGVGAPWKNLGCRERGGRWPRDLAAHARLPPLADEDVCVFKCSVSRETECSRVGKQSFIITLGCNSVLIQFATPSGTSPFCPSSTRSAQSLGAYALSRGGWGAWSPGKS